MSDDCSILNRMGRAVFAGLVVAVLAPPCLAEPGPSPAVPGGANAGEALEANPEMRRLRLKHHWTGESLDVVYRIGAAYQPEAMAQIDHFMRDWRCGKVMEMDPALIDRIYELHQRIGTRRTIRLVSGFRSEGYNASLLLSGRTVDPESQHMFGRAVDIFVPGLGTDKLKEAAQALALGGVGHYPFSGPRFVHIDTGPQRQWTEMDPGARRRLGLTRRGRTRFKLNCDMTMADALHEISPIDAIAALPPGAAVDPAASFQRAAFAQAAPLNDRAQRDGACEAGDPLPPLGLLAGAQDLRGPH
jgi:uncharacterized protein YcbK (DUF882 family)